MRTAFIVRNLIQLTQGASCGDLTSLEAMMALLVTRGHIPPAVVRMLWDTFTLKVPGSTTEDSRAAVLIPLIPCSSKLIGFRKFRPFLPHPGSDDWGEGQLLVTTRDRSILDRDTCAMHYVMPPMSEANAVSLLYKVSGYEGEGAQDVVNSHHVGTLPLNVARWA